MRVASLLLLLGLSHQLDASRVRRQEEGVTDTLDYGGEEDKEVDYGEYGDKTGPQCSCGGSFPCYCVMNIQCFLNGSINYYGVNNLGVRSSILVETCPDPEHTCCRDTKGLEEVTTENPPPTSSKSPPSRKCGIRGERKGTSLSDSDTEFGEFPWMLAIYWKNGTTWQFQCGASLVGKDLALTAAHCVEGFKNNPTDLRVRADIWNLDDNTTPYQALDVIGIMTHPEFSRGPLWNDIALIQTRQMFKRKASVGPVCLPPLDYKFTKGTRCIATGWGKNVYGSTGKLRSTLRKVEVPLMPNDECQKRMRRTYLGRFFILHESFLCAGGESTADTCQRDGGGPLVCEIGGQYFQAGIVSWGIDCNVKRLPGVYVEVSRYTSWLKQTMINS